MLATAGPVPTGEGWGFEFKWDGVRAIVDVQPDQARISSRTGRDASPSYPELSGQAGLPAMFGGRRAILDGEIVAFDERGVPSFAVLQQRMHVRAPSRGLVAAVPVQLYVFDLLMLDGNATIGLPYRRRREMLEQLSLSGPLVRTPPMFTGSGTDLLDVARDTGLEGVLAKRLDSPYQPGQRSRAWIKSPLEQTVEVVVGGWKPGAGRRAGKIGSLLVGSYDPGGHLTYAGHVGTGFTEHALRSLQGRLAPLELDVSPFDSQVPREHARQAHWVRPALVGEVAFRNITPDGLLRHPSWRGLLMPEAPNRLDNKDDRR